jgi:formylglycine-generating enzyme required for sulfatase activity
LNHIVKTKPQAPGGNQQLDAIVLKALAKDPSARYADANEFAEDLQRFIDGQPIAAMRSITKRRRTLAVVMLAVIGLLATLAVYWNHKAHDRTQPMVNGRPRIDLASNFSFVWIPPGEFVMGSPPGEVGRLPDEEPHKVAIERGFYMLINEVPQEIYESVMGSNPSKFKNYIQPVEQVSWHDAQEFCRRYSRVTGKTIRLPTEAEWEYACRAGSTTNWSFGDNQELAPRYANFYDASSPETRPGRSAMNDGFPHTAYAARFIANNFGLVDMHGNVWEWCQDEYRPYTVSPSDTTTRDTRRVSRGGSWYDAVYSMRSAHRNPLDPSFKNDNLGFRVVMEDPADQNR